MLITLPPSFRTSLSGVLADFIAEVETADGSDENAKCGDQQNLHDVFSFTSAFAAVRTLPTPDPSGYVDRESSVVVAFPTNLGRQVAMTLAAPFAPTNALEVGLGWDRNGNGDLEPEETEVRMGVDCGVSQVKVESKAKVEVEQRNLSACAFGFTFRQPKNPTDRYSFAKVTTHNMAETNVTVTAKFTTPGFAIILR